MWDYPYIDHIPDGGRHLPTSLQRHMMIQNEVASLASIISSPQHHPIPPGLVRRMRWLVWVMQMLEQHS